MMRFSLGATALLLLLLLSGFSVPAARAEKWEFVAQPPEGPVYLNTDSITWNRANGSVSFWIAVQPMTWSTRNTFFMPMLGVGVKTGKRVSSAQFKMSVYCKGHQVEFLQMAFYDAKGEALHWDRVPPKKHVTSINAPWAKKMEARVCQGKHESAIKARPF